MTGAVPGALPPRTTVYESPAIAPEEMTAEQAEQHRVAQVAAIVASAAAARAVIADNITLHLVPLLRTINLFNPADLVWFGLRAAEMVEIGRQESARISWSSIISQLEVYDVPMVRGYDRVGPGRATDLETAYQRPGASYRTRMAAGVESIVSTIAQAEEERFQALGGAVVAEGRRGESNAEVAGTSRSPSSSGQTSSSSGSSSGGAGSSASGPATRSPVDTARADRSPDEDADDREAADRQGEAGPDEGPADPVAAEQALRRRAALTDADKQNLLAQVAQHDAEIRLERMVNDDIAIAGRDAARDALAQAPRGRVTGYRRVIHPELSRTGVCGLCIAASDRKYKVAELLPLHGLCKCEVCAIINGKDPGSQINADDLDTLYEEAGDSTFGWDLKEQRYQVFDHPELGPRLRNAAHSIRDISYSPREPSAAHRAKNTPPGETA